MNERSDIRTNDDMDRSDGWLSRREADAKPDSESGAQSAPLSRAEPEGEGRELKPCPFCGSEAELNDAILHMRPALIVECTDCYASVAASLDRALAVDMWNRRDSERPA